MEIAEALRRLVKMSQEDLEAVHELTGYYNSNHLRALIEGIKLERYNADPS
jgi:hypothetical protein